MISLQNNKHFIIKNKNQIKKLDSFWQIKKNKEPNLLYNEKNYMIII